MSKYLIEIGTEELPYSFIPSAIEQFKSYLEKELKENRIEYKELKTYGTPRRLAAIVDEISECQPDLERVVKGPPVRIAIDAEGNYTKAAIGFSKKAGLPLEDFYKDTMGNEEYIFAKVQEVGKPTKELLPQIVSNVVFGMHGSHFMRWADLEQKFSRPIRWVVSLLDSEEVPVELTGIKSSKYSRGHRFYEQKEVEIISPDTYLDDLYKAKVIVDTKQRQDVIVEEAKKVAKKVNGNVHLDPELLKEVTYITEWPVGVLGSFDKKYLDIPQEVTVTVMASHQRYFPVFDENNNQLLNNFVTMANYLGDSFENIARGNERVIKARLDDAIFFFKDDTKIPLEQRVEKLKGVTFQKGLGSIYDKVSRIREISYYISTEMELPKEDIEKIERTALLAKADLVTSLVFEFTELQGYIGSEYAMLDKEPQEVVNGIKEHYYPLSADGELAGGLTGQITGIADKIDTICGVFALGKIPTGSADPLGLRRAALGILLTIIKKDLNINLSNVIENAVSMQPIEIEDKQELVNKIREFIIQRLRGYVAESYKYDVVEAVLASKDPLQDLHDFCKRLDVVSSLVNSENYSKFHEAANRVHRIIKSENLSISPDANLFVQDAEVQLWNCICDIEGSKLTYDQLVEKLVSMLPVVEKFFDDVLVMDKDESIKKNRIAMLTTLKNKFFDLADFSKIVE